MIPLSGRITKYKRIMDKKEKAGRTCDIIHIAKMDDGRESAFLIQDMFPITNEYIEREYTIDGNHLLLTSEHTVKFTPTQPNVMVILEKLLETKK